MVRRTGSHADANRDDAGQWVSRMGNTETLHQRAQTPCDVQCSFLIRLWHHENKFFAAVSRCQVSWTARDGSNLRCDRSKALITRHMSIAIIEQFEVIRIDHQHGEREFASRTSPPFLLYELIEASAVGKPSQSVDRCRELNLVKRIA